MACGTGKTTVGAAVSAQVAGAGRVLILVPTLELLAQTAKEYVAYLGDEAGTLGAVCSDDSATVEAHRLRAELDELHVGSTTKPQDVAAWTRRRGRVTVLCTYKSLPVLVAAHRQKTYRWDLLIADEAHRTAGRVDRTWHVVHDDAAIPARRRLYMTATPRIVETGEFEVTSMDDPAVFGPEVFQLSFAQAINDGLLADYQVLVTTMTETELVEPDAVVNAGGPAVPLQMLVAQLALLRAAADHGVRRAISFHHRVASARRFAETLPNTANLLPARKRPHRLYAAAVDGTMAADDRRAILSHLNKPAGRLVVVSNARVLGEGVDVPELDAVLFADPRDSATDIVQAIGRALRRGSSASKMASIIIPIVLNEAETPDAALDLSAWDILYRVLRALRAHDERLADWLDTHRARVTTFDVPQLGTRRAHQLPPWLQLTGQRVDRKFAAAVALRVLERTTSPWLGGLAAATEYHAEHGNLRVPPTYVTPGGMKLGIWVINQRDRKRQGTLTDAQLAALDALNMTWDAVDAARDEWLTRARAYRKQHGDLRVPVKYVSPDGAKLGTWICTQRDRKGNLTPEQIAELDALGMIWDALEDGRAKWIASAKEFKVTHGHLRVPSTYVAPDGTKLGGWIAGQRHRKRGSKLTKAQIAELEALGMVWGRDEPAKRSR